ncbi:MAG: DEAD/DEAH box helicase [Micrococcaceae bacterium]
MLSLKTIIQADHKEQLRHEHVVPARKAEYAQWPSWLSDSIKEAFKQQGISKPYSHQIKTAEISHAGSHVIIATGTASGKSLGYGLPALQSVLEEQNVLYVSPTKALAVDQAQWLNSLNVQELRAEVYDGDTEQDTRKWIREHANYILTNPDMLHHGMLPHHELWSRFFKNLEYVIIDEAHHYRGVFGSHVANVLRRLKRICQHYGADPVFIGASATSADPAASFSKLIGQEATAVTKDSSAKAQQTICLWEPALLPGSAGENGAPIRRSAVYECADLLTDLVCGSVKTLAFVRSRRSTEVIIRNSHRLLEAIDPHLIDKVVAYRSGYLKEERREIEHKIATGEILAVASTNALELGVDINSLDAVIMTGWPGTRASFWQQAGRAGRGTKESIAIFIAQDDPLDTYMVNHPEALFGKDVEETVFDPENPYILAAHLCAAAAEIPLGFDEVDVFGSSAREVVHDIVDQGILKRRATGWFWTDKSSPTEYVSLRNTGGEPLKIIDETDGSIIGTIDAASSHTMVHHDAVYLHQGRSYIVSMLDEMDGIVLVRAENTSYFTHARDVTDIEIEQQFLNARQGQGQKFFGAVRVENQVVSFQKKDQVSRETLGEYPLDLQARQLYTQAVWFTVDTATLEAGGVAKGDIPGATHAAEHAMIALLPLVATSDRWDIGGVSIAVHPDTGLPTIFVYDGHQGGAGFAERGYHAAQTWIKATLDTILSCECEGGCPSCVQSPKCGNRNEPLDKAKAAVLLKLLL